MLAALPTLVLATLGYLAAHRLGYVFTRPELGVSLLWPAAGVGLGLLILTRRDRRLLLLAGMAGVSLASNLLSAPGLFAALTYTSANVLFLWLALVVCQELAAVPEDLDRVASVGALGVAAVGVSLPSALLGAGAAVADAQASFWQPLHAWWASSALGVVLPCAILLAWARPGDGIPRRFRRRVELAGFALLWVATCAVTWRAGDSLALDTLGLPVLAALVTWGVIRFGSQVLTAAFLLLAVATLARPVPDGAVFFVPGQLAGVERILQIQTYLAVGALLTLLFNAALAERRATGVVAARAKERLGLALGAATLGTWEWVPAEDRVEWSENVARIFGMTPGDFGGRFEDYFSRIHPEDREVVQARLQAVTHQGEDAYLIQHRILRPDGSVGWVEGAAGRVERGQDGEVIRMLGTVRDITEQREAEREAEQQRRRSEAIVDAAMDGIITVDQDQRVAVFNPAAELMFGWSAEEALGEPLDRFIPARFREEHREHIRRFGRTGVSSRTMGTFGKITGLRRDGNEFPIEASISQVEVDGEKLYTVTCRDVTRRYEAERSLQESRERFQQLVENIREVFWLVDARSGGILYVSPGLERVWGRDPEEFVADASLFIQSVHTEDRNHVRAQQRDHGSGEPQQYEYRIVRPDGSIRWISERAFPIRDEEGEIYRVAGISEDITERREAEDQLRQAQKMEAIGQLAGGVAHDFNNILGAMMMQIDVLREEAEALGSEGRSTLSELEDASRRAADLTRQLLLFGRKQTMRPEALELNTAVERLGALLRRLLRADVRLEVAPYTEPVLAMADPGMVDQILMNLAVNAQDAMPGGGTVTISTGVRTVEGEREGWMSGAPGAYSVITVSDTGVGIPPELRERIFEPFFTTKGVGKGTGLGLATVFGIVRQHGGFLELESEPGEGTTFRVHIPRAEEAERHPGEGATEAPEAEGESVPGGTILLVEDDRALRRMAIRVLERSGFTVLPAEDGVEALRLWDAHRDAVDLVLTDLMMPGGVRGTDLARQLRAGAPEIRVVFMSGYSSDSQEGRLEGEHFIQKPYSTRDLVELVRKVLQQ